MFSLLWFYMPANWRFGPMCVSYMASALHGLTTCPGFRCCRLSGQYWDQLQIHCSPNDDHTVVNGKLKIP